MHITIGCCCFRFASQQTLMPLGKENNMNSPCMSWQVKFPTRKLDRSHRSTSSRWTFYQGENMKRRSNRKCGKCGHTPSIAWLVSPGNDAPKDRIHIVLSTESFSFFCNGCGHFTILCQSQSEYDAQMTLNTAV